MTLRFTSIGPWAAPCLLAMVLAACGDGGAAAPASPDQHVHAPDEPAHSEPEHTDEVRLTEDALARYGVKVEAAQLWALRPTFVAPARVAFNAEAMAHVGSPLSGRIAQLYVKLGSAVAVGDPLVLVHSPELGEAQSDFLIKRTAAESALPAVDLAKVSWDRARSLHETTEGSISLTEVQRREAEYKVAVAGQRGAHAAAVAAENRLHLLGMKQDAVAALAASGEVDPRFVIDAPIAGQVVEREITLGELVGPDRDSLLIIADTSTLWVLADVPEARLHAVAVGATAWVAVGSGGGPTFEGRVAFIAPMVDPTTRTAQLRIETPGGALGGGAIRPGMFAHAEIVATTPDGADPAPQVAVAREAIQTVEGGPAVFVPVEGEPNTFAKRAVTIGPAVGGLVPVFAGLVEGERFVAAGSFILKAELGKGSAAHEH